MDGVPDRVAVPLPLFVYVRPAILPLWVTFASGHPVVVKVKVKAWPWVAVADEALVIAGAWSTVSVNAWVVEAKPLPAMKEIG